MQETEVWSLVWEDAMCQGATKPVRDSYWACALEPRRGNFWGPRALEPVLATREATAMRSLHTTTREKPTFSRETTATKEKPAQ